MGAPSPDRIPCLNPRCRRTAPAERYPGEEVVCRKCWRLLPGELVERDRSLRRRMRQMERLARRPGREAQAEHLLGVLARCHGANWARIRAYLAAPPMPEGLERHLAELGLDR